MYKAVLDEDNTFGKPKSFETVRDVLLLLCGSVVAFAVACNSAVRDGTGECLYLIAERRHFVVC